MTLLDRDKSKVTNELASCPGDHGRNEVVNPEPLHVTPCLPPSSDVDIWHTETGKNCNGDLLVVPKKQLLLEGEEADMPAGNRLKVAMAVAEQVDRANKVNEDITSRRPQAFAGHHLDSMPGAYAQMPGESTHARSNDENASLDIMVMSGSEATENDEEGLVVANLVEDRSLEFASSASEEPGIQRAYKNRQYKTFVLLSVIFLSAVGAVILAVLFPSIEHQASQHQADNWTIASASPSQAQGSLKGHVLSILPEMTANTILDDSNSPCSRAFQWLLDDDHLPHIPDEQIKQRFALATLYFSTNGDGWTDNTNWLNHSISECDWYTRGEFFLQSKLSVLLPGLLSGFFSTEPVAICDQHGLYQHLWLDQNNLVGSLPEELYMLTHLQTISMAFDGIQGAISTRIGLLTGLEALGMLFSGSAGTIPTQLGLLTDIRFVSFDDSDHEGTIPTEIWGLTKLEYFILGKTPQLKGNIPTEIGILQNLKWLGMDGTGLSGTIPSEIALIESLEMVSLADNSLSGMLPSELGLLTGLFLLGLASSGLTGTISTNLGLLTSLSQLTLRDNRLEGLIPSQLGLLTKLSWALNLRNNKLTGTIPSELGLLTGLSELELRDNRLTGQIPSELGRATSMGFLSFANNSLSGSIPRELYSLHASLHTLSLEDNPLLSGILPNAICRINGTCIGNGFNTCEGPYGFSFDCSSLLCGCGCNLCFP